MARRQLVDVSGGGESGVWAVTKKVVGALLLIVAVAVFLTIREEGTDEAFGGILAPLETVRVNDPSKNTLGNFTTGNSIPSTSQTDYGRITDRVRSRVNASMRESERRVSRH